MSGIGKLMQRLGYVKLDAYGLRVTPDDRILATRPTILDDGDGGRIVGWRHGDLAAMELATWAPTAAVPVAPVAPRPRAPMPRLATAPTIAGPPMATRSLPGVAPYVPVYVPPMPVVPVTAFKGAATIKPAPLDSPLELTEDEWEWEIAVARARAAADEVSLARVIPIAQARKPKFVSQEPATWPTHDDLGDDTQVSAATAPARQTVIPVPRLPATAARAISRVPQPMVRRPEPPPGRLPKGTVTPGSNSEPSSPMLHVGDETVPGMAPAPPPLPKRMANR